MTRLLIATLLAFLGLPQTGGRIALRFAAAAAQPAPVVTVSPVPATGEESAAEAGNEDAKNVEAVIPSGQDELLAEMLGRGVDLPGPCKFAGAKAERTSIQSRYTCPAGETVVELFHPSRAPDGATQTSKFAIAVRSGTPPDGLTASLASRIRSREAAFEWKWVGPPPSEFSPWIFGLQMAALLAIAILGWALRSRFRRAKSR